MNSSFNLLADKKIIIADDEEMLREVIVMRFSEYGAHCLETDNGEAVIDILMKENVDLIISDVRMPKVTGIELLQQLEDKEIFLNRPIIMMSGFTNLSLDQAKGLGAITIINKPFMMDELLSLSVKVLLEM